MSSEYRTLTFHRSQAREESSSLTWIISNETEMCYCIEARADAVLLHREGTLADKLPVATLHGAAAPTIAFGGEKPVPLHHLLVTHSRYVSPHCLVCVFLSGTPCQDSEGAL